jgi:hypothetical protein
MVDTENIVFLDYDDTILCTTMLDQCGYKLNSELDNLFANRYLLQLDRVVANYLQKLVLISHVYIITNSETGWVYLSSHKFLPQSSNILDHITVISGNSTYSGSYPGDYVLWKYLSMKDCLSVNNFHRYSLLNIISIGDSDVEKNAVHKLVNDYSNCCIKNIKFIEKPSCEVLINEINKCSEKIDDLMIIGDNLDYQLQNQFSFLNVTST